MDVVDVGGSDGGGVMGGTEVVLDDDERQGHGGEKGKKGKTSPSESSPINHNSESMPAATFQAELPRSPRVDALLSRDREDFPCQLVSSVHTLVHFKVSNPTANIILF